MTRHVAKLVKPHLKPAPAAIYHTDQSGNHLWYLSEEIGVILVTVIPLKDKIAPQSLYWSGQ